jgi:iron complex outermembrane receptor protein
MKKHKTLKCSRVFARRHTPLVKLSTWLAALVCVTPFGLTGLPARSQALEEIVVTSQRREQSAQDVPISITAFSADQLRSFGMSSSADIAAQTPGVLLNGASTGGINILPSIRGVTQNDFTPHQEPPNATYIDEAYISSSAALSFNLFDTQRVEVLRGPQGTLFGRNATGGAIQFVSNKPTPDLQGYADVSEGSFDSHRVEAALSGPVTSTILGRVAVLYDEHEPWWKNDAPANTPGGNGDSFGQHFLGVRGQLQFLISDSLDDLVSFTRGEDRRHPEGTYKSIPGALNPLGLGYDISPTANPNGTCPGCDDFGYRDPKIARPFESSFADVGFIQKEYSGATNKLTWKADAFTLTSISNYQRFSFDYRENCDGTPYAVCEFLLSQSMHQLSEELRLNGQYSALNWTAGAYFLDISEVNGQGYDTNVSAGSSLAPFALVSREVFPQSTETAALFGQTEYTFAPRWSLITGLRLSHDRKTFHSSTFAPGEAPYYEYSAANGDQTFLNKSDWAGKVEIDWKAVDHLLLYAGVTKGNKGPGFNATPVGALPAGYSVKFDAEELIDYETGWKWSFADGRARLNGSAYYYDYRGYQAFEYILLSTVVTNKDAKLYGSELEFSAEPGAGWMVGTGLGLENGVVYDVRLPHGDIANRMPPAMPHVTGNAVVRKTFALAHGALSLQVDGRYVGWHFASVSNAPATEIPGAALFNARVGYEANDHWEVAGEVRNLANRGVVNYAFDLSGSYGLNIKSYQQPRWYTVNLRYRF